MFDPSYPDVNIDTFLNHEWKKFYGNVKEAIPPYIPEPLGNEVVMRCFVDANRAGEKLTRHSCSGFIIVLQMARIYYCLKRHNTVETCTFGSEFMDMKLACECICGLQYKLRMMGIPFSDICFMYGDNK